jgi:hypothetical protein
VIPALATSRAIGPRRRFRGKKAYFRRVMRAARAVRIEPGPTAWWDLWHYHADWRGWGNRRWRYRRAHLAALAHVFEMISSLAERFTTPFQAWILLSGRDAGEDAVFLHTPNPNGSEFPCPFVGPEWAWGHEALRPFFRSLLPGRTLRVGRWQGQDDDADPPRVVTSIQIYCPEVGVPLEARPTDDAATAHG